MVSLTFQNRFGKVSKSFQNIPSDQIYGYGGSRRVLCRDDNKFVISNYLFNMTLIDIVYF